MTPRFQHDCDSCVFVGQIEDVDVWYCPGRDSLGASVIARHGDVGYEYGSMAQFVWSHVYANAGDDVKQCDMYKAWHLVDTLLAL